MKRLTRKNRRKSSSRKGASSVEFAVVFPLVLTFIFGSITAAQGFLIRDLSQLAAYEAARRGTVLDATAQEVEARAIETLRGINLRDARISITPDTINNNTQEIEVSIEIPMSSNAWVGGPFLPDNWLIGSRVTLRKTDN